MSQSNYAQKTTQEKQDIMSGLVSHFLLKGGKCHLSNYKIAMAQ